MSSLVVVTMSVFGSDKKTLFLNASATIGVLVDNLRKVAGDAEVEISEIDMEMHLGADTPWILRLVGSEVTVSDAGGTFSLTGKLLFNQVTQRFEVDSNYLAATVNFHFEEVLSVDFDERLIIVGRGT